MMEAKKKESSHWWWLDSHNRGNSNRSPWLQRTLAEIDEKTKTMLKLIEEDADSFAKRAEMYYKKRPELISMVEDFYRTHRSLAERYDQVKSEPATRLLSSPWSSPLPFTRYRLEKCPSLDSKAYDSFSEAYGPEDSDESEVDDPEEEEEEYTLQAPLLSFDDNELVRPREEEDTLQTPLVSFDDNELVRLREEVERLMEENEAQQEQLKEKDEEKREVIRQLSVAMDLLRDENAKLRESLAKKTTKREIRGDYNRLKESFFGRLFDGFGKTRANLVAL